VQSKSGLTTIVGLGIVTVLFMAFMSMFYLQQIPTQADLDRLQDDLRTEHGLYLSAAAPIQLSLLRPDEDGNRTGIEIRCILRADIRKRPKVVELYITRIGDSVLTHPEWRGKVGFVTVVHSVKPDVVVTRWATQPGAGEP